jgi:hypothetical protein
LLYYAPLWGILTTNTLVPGSEGNGVFFINIHSNVKASLNMENVFEESVKQELKSMDQRLYDMEEKIGSIDTKLTQVVDAILGNPLTKTGGFVNDIDILQEKIKVLEQKVEKQEEFKKRLIWTIGLILAGAMIVQYIVDLYSHIK